MSQLCHTELQVLHTCSVSLLFEKEANVVDIVTQKQIGKCQKPHCVLKTDKCCFISVQLIDFNIPD